MAGSSSKPSAPEDPLNFKWDGETKTGVIPRMDMSIKTAKEWLLQAHSIPQKDPVFSAALARMKNKAETDKPSAPRANMAQYNRAVKEHPARMAKWLCSLAQACNEGNGEGFNRVMPQVPVMPEEGDEEDDRGFILPKQAFLRLVQEIMLEYGDDFHLRASAAAVLQEAAEAELVAGFEDAMLFAGQDGRELLKPKDMERAKKAREKANGRDEKKGNLDDTEDVEGVEEMEDDVEDDGSDEEMQDEEGEGEESGEEDQESGDEDEMDSGED